MKKEIVILGGGFAGTTLLRQLQTKFKDNSDIRISLVGDDNFFLFTPMLPEVASGMLHAGDVSTPIRLFCKHAQFYHAQVKSVDFNKKQITIDRIFDNKKIILSYDFLVFALGSIDNFFGNENMRKYSFTIKTLEDSLAIRNHVISMLESADNESNIELQDELSNFVVIGGGFAGVEIASEINHLVQDASKTYYPNIDRTKLKVILISARNGILPEVGEELGKFALDSIRKDGIQVITNTKALDAGEDYVILDDERKTKINCGTLVWAGGVKVDPLVAALDCKHDSSGRIIVDEYLRVQGQENVYALGDCAFMIDKSSGIPYPPTAQIAIRAGKVTAKNIIRQIAKNYNDTLESFTYHNKGIMATIGKRNAVALIGGRKIHGFLAWILWRFFYLSNLPTREKKVRVAMEWFLDIFFKHSDILTVGIIKHKEVTDNSEFYDDTSEHL